jgi:hypothetical protein
VPAGNRNCDLFPGNRGFYVYPVVPYVPYPGEWRSLEGFTNWDIPAVGNVAGGLTAPCNHLYHRAPVGRGDCACSDGAPEARNDWYPGGTMPHPPEVPTVQHNLMEIAVFVPQVWNGTEFESAHLTRDYMLETYFSGALMQFNVQDARRVSPNFDFHISDFFGDAIVHNQVAGTVVATDPRGSRDNEDFVRIILDGPQPYSMAPSQIFPRSFLNVGFPPGTIPPEGIVFRNVTYMGNLHTFFGV